MMRYGMRRRYIDRTWIVLGSVALCLVLLLTGFLITKRLKKQVELPIGSSAQVAQYDGRVITLENNTLIGSNTYGREKFRAQVNGADTLCIGDGAAAAYGDNDVYLFERSGRITAHISTDTPIRHVVCGTGILSVVTQDAAGAVQVSVYDVYANLIDRLDSSVFLSGDRIMDAGMRGNLLWLSTVDTDGAQMLCHVYLFNVQANTFLCRMDVTQQLIYDVFMDEKNVFLIGTDSIICYNHSGMRLWQMPCSDLTYVYGCEYRGNAVLVLHYDAAQGGRMIYRAQVYPLSRTSKAFALQGRKLYMLQEDGLYTMDLRRESHSVQLQLPCGYEDMIPVTRNRMLVLDGGKWSACMIP